MLWLEGLAWAFLGTGSGVGIASISYVVKTRGWSYFAKLKTPFKQVRRKALSLSMIAELGADMAMDKWDEEFRKLVAGSRPAEPSLTATLAKMQEAVERAQMRGVVTEKNSDMRISHRHLTGNVTMSRGGLLAPAEKRRVPEEVQRPCPDCEYVDQSTYGDRHVRLLKIWACSECHQRDRRRADREAMNRLREIYSARA